MIVFETNQQKNLEFEAVELQACFVAEKLKRGYISAAEAAIELIELLRQIKGGEA